jgi:hypothetical protein
MDGRRMGVSYRMCGWEFCDCDIGGSFVCFEGLVGALLAFVSEGKLSKVTMIISLPVQSAHAQQAKKCNPNSRGMKEKREMGFQDTDIL